MTECLPAEIVTIGDEVLAGRTLNTNASHIARALDDIGVDVRWVTVCGDSRSDIDHAFRSAWDRARVIVTTGGLGPTHDDITTKAFADYFGREFERSDDVLGNIERLFAERGREMTDRNRSQADVPADTEVLMNHVGTAPGIYLQEDDRHWFMLPGVPREMRYLMEQYVVPRLSSLTGGDAIVRRDVHVVGWPESNLMDEIHELPGIDCVASLPDERGEITLRISVRDVERAAAEGRAREIESRLRERLGADVYGVGDVTLESAVGELLRAQGAMLATAESCTGGLLGSRITDAPGSSEYYAGGLVTYSNAAKVSQLRVPASLIEEHGAVSGHVARAMAIGARDVFGADVAASLTGIAGPGGGTEQKPVGLVFIGLAWDEGSAVAEHRFGSRRELNKLRSTQAALDMVRRHLLHQTELRRK